MNHKCWCQHNYIDNYFMPIWKSDCVMHVVRVEICFNIATCLSDTGFESLESLQWRWSATLTHWWKNYHFAEISCLYHGTNSVTCSYFCVTCVNRLTHRDYFPVRLSVILRVGLLGQVFLWPCIHQGQSHTVLRLFLSVNDFVFVLKY